MFISNNIHTAEYAKNVQCPVYIIGSKGDSVLGASLQEKLASCFETCELKLFDAVKHEEYFYSQEVISYIKQVID